MECFGNAPLPYSIPLHENKYAKYISFGRLIFEVNLNKNIWLVICFV
jgi:hypothetical protein